MPNVAQLNQSIKANRMAESGEWLDWYLYSSVVCGTAGATVNLNFFQDSIASVGKAKTNMETPAQLNSNKTFLITAIEMIIFNRDGSIISSDNTLKYPPNLIAATMYGELKINQVTALDIQGWMFREVHERVVAATQVGASSVNAITNRTLRLKAPIQIDPQTNFIITTTHVNPAADNAAFSATLTEVMFRFRGLMKRFK